MTDLAEAKGLLSSGEDQLQDPFLMKDMDLATARIGRALRNGEKIAVYGDYDVDGITSTCLLTHYLRAQGGDVCYYIPNRLSEGYGVNREAVEELARQGVRLMITVDCGITAVEEAAYASGLGIDVIITDHHECKEEIPAAVAVVDPHRKDCPYPFKGLAGVGVALKLVMALGGKAVPRPLPGVRRPGRRGHGGRRDEAFGGEPHHCPGGPEPPEKTRRRGLYALMVEAGTLNRAITSTTVGYCLSPRINASGRMGRAVTAAELILTEDNSQAELLAHELCELNRQGQAVELEIFNEFLALLAGREQYDCLVLADKAWHQGRGGHRGLPPGGAVRLPGVYDLPPGRRQGEGLLPVLRRVQPLLRPGAVRRPAGGLRRPRPGGGLHHSGGEHPRLPGPDGGDRPPGHRGRGDGLHPADRRGD